ncbi:unnamed protein product [Calypogeia fissa]
MRIIPVIPSQGLLSVVPYVSLGHNSRRQSRTSVPRTPARSGPTFWVRHVPRTPLLVGRPRAPVPARGPLFESIHRNGTTAAAGEAQGSGREGEGERKGRVRFGGDPIDRSKEEQ